MPQPNNRKSAVSKGNARSLSHGSRMRRRVLAIAIATIITTALVLWIKPLKFIPPIGNGKNELPSSDATAAQADVLAGYGGSESCKNCHRSEYDRWVNSHHALAERPVAKDLDRIAFDPPRTIKHASQISQVRIEKGKYQIVTADLSGKPQPHTAVRVIGVDPLRQFLVDGGRGRMQAMELAYDPRRNEWFDVYGAEDRQPGEWGHWTGRGMTWNAMCATCHN
ncbi:MAG TPA: hypothetical protein VFC46_12470, partial [Humisphaera sp.]|nr:hypothetical protein [Humisphaera sp.]